MNTGKLTMSFSKPGLRNPTVMPQGLVFIQKYDFLPKFLEFCKRIYHD